MKILNSTIVLVAVLAGSVAASAQDLHIPFPIEVVEQHLKHERIDVLGARGARMEVDRTQYVMLGFGDLLAMPVKWAVAPPGGESFNNVPRYEAAAYELQKLFLEEPEYVVPPTVIRAFPLDWYRENYEVNARPTFRNTESVLVALQYWLSAPLAPHSQLDRQRFEADEEYARHFANLNVLTYLIRHSDSNVGNVLISEAEIPRLFAVDNGVAFQSVESNRGTYWRDLHVRRIPLETAERLRRIGVQDLESRLAVIAEFALEDGVYVSVDPGENLRANAGSRAIGNRLQFGLTAGEIRDINGRLTNLVRRIESGAIETF